MNDTETFMQHNFVPPSLRRFIDLLGFLHKRVLFVCHPAVVHCSPSAQYRGPQNYIKSFITFIGEMRHHWLFNFSLIYFYNFIRVSVYIIIIIILLLLLFFFPPSSVLSSFIFIIGNFIYLFFI